MKRNKKGNFQKTTKWSEMWLYHHLPLYVLLVYSQYSCSIYREGNIANIILCSYTASKNGVHFQLPSAHNQTSNEILWNDLRWKILYNTMVSGVKPWNCFGVSVQMCFNALYKSGENLNEGNRSLLPEFLKCSPEFSDENYPLKSKKLGTKYKSTA